jgi:GT2 family glycosyltransferase
VLIAYFKMMTTANEPRVSVITVNYNSTPVTVELLKSLQKHPYPNLEVIIVDNASKQDPTADLKAILPDAKIIRSSTNLGFAGGNNLGIIQSTGSYILFINNDTEITAGAIEKMVSTLMIHPDAGAISPKVQFFFHPGILEYAGYNSMNFFTARASMRGNKEIDSGDFDSFSETNYAHGAGMMVPRSVIDSVGVMPECYFLYYEELDWCEMMKRHGFKIYYEPKALIFHKESMTTGKASTLKTYYLNRNRILFMRRNASSLQFLIFFTYFLFITLPKNSLVFLIKREWKHLHFFYRAIFWHFSYSSK